MRPPPRHVRAAALLCCLVLLVLAGACGTEPEKKDTTPVGLQPPNDTPQNTILRLVAAYEQGKTAEYRAMFTGDFEFVFSVAADPPLASKWSAGWFAADESASARHLFEGGTNLDGVYQPAANAIDVVFTKTQPTADTTGGRDPTQYQMLLTPVDATIEVPYPPYESLTYIIANNAHRFHLVRGDAAVGLTAEQPADSLHWYIWAWKDETVYLGTPGAVESRPAAVRSSTWGRVKGLYR